MSDFFTNALDWVRSPDYRDVTTREIALLGILCDEEGPHHVRHLADTLKVSKPVITRSVSRLTREGLATKARSGADKRDKEVRASIDAGQARRGFLKGLRAAQGC